MIAPLALVQEALPLLKSSHGLVVNLSSDAARGGYETWGGYGSSKAALDLISLTLANELKADGVAVVSVDPGDMRTEMHQAAYLGEDIPDRPLPDVTLPVLGVALWTGSDGDHRRALSGAGRTMGGGERIMKRAELIFTRPLELQATAPAEARGVPRDQARLMVSSASDQHEHAHFYDLPRFLNPGDLLVVNDSATLPASLPATGSSARFIVNFATDFGNGTWLVEPRWSTSQPGPLPLSAGEESESRGLTTRLIATYPGLPRLWFAQVDGDVHAAMKRVGAPIRYGYVTEAYPLSTYQTVFARQTVKRCPAAPRCLRRPIRSPSASSTICARAASRSPRSRCTRASPASKSRPKLSRNTRFTRSRSRFPKRRPRRSTPRGVKGGASSPPARPSFARSNRPGMGMKSRRATPLRGSTSIRSAAFTSSTG